MRRSSVGMAGGLCALVAISGCGSSSRQAATGPAVTPAAPPPGQKTFSAPGMAVHFSFPPRFTLRLARFKRVAGNATQGSEAAVGVGRYDLLIVSRFPHRPIAVTSRNIARLRPQFDSAVSGALGHEVRSTVTSVDGLPALSYPPAPVSGLGAAVTSRITNVFVGSDEYELNCQYTRAHARLMTRACGEMLATLTVSR